MRGNARDFGLFLERTVGHVGYILGTRGELCSPVLRAKCAISYPAQAVKILAASKWDGLPVADCMGWEEMFENGGDVGKPVSKFLYPDRRTQDDYASAQAMGLPHGPMSTLPKDMPDYPIAVGYTGHVGYFYKGKVYQSAGHVTGTVISDLNVVLSGLATWQYWYQMPYLDYAKEEIVVKYGDSGPQVLAWQNALVSAGYIIYTPTGAVSPPDGKFGPNTLKYTNIFKKDELLTQDGLVDEITFGRMLDHLRKKPTCDPLIQAALDLTGQKLDEAQTALTNITKMLDQAHIDQLALEQSLKSMTLEKNSWKASSEDNLRDELAGKALV